MRFLISTFLVVWCAALGAQARASADAVKVELKPADAAEYWIRNIESSRREGFEGKPEPGADQWHAVDTLALVRQTVRAGEAGFLEVTVEPLGKSVRINNRKIEVEDDRSPYDYRISTTGEMPDMKAMGEVAAACAPTFPAGPVAPGTSWKTKVESTPAFPAAFEVTHTLDKVEEFQGEPAAFIMTSGKTVAKDKDLAFSLSVSGLTRVGLKSGMMLKSNTMTNFAVSAAKRFKEGYKVQRRQVERVVERRVPGAPDDVH